MKEADTTYHISSDHKDENNVTDEQHQHEIPVAPQQDPAYGYPPYQTVYQPNINPQYYQTRQPVYGQIPPGINPAYYQYQPPQGYQYNPYINPVVNPYNQTIHTEPESHTSTDENSHTEDHPGQERIPKHDEHKYGQFMDIVNDVASGNPPDMSKVMEIMSGTDTQFIKGAVVGAVSTFLLTNETVKNTAVNMMAKIMNAFGKAE